MVAAMVTVQGQLQKPLRDKPRRKQGGVMYSVLRYTSQKCERDKSRDKGTVSEETTIASEMAEKVLSYFPLQTPIHLCPLNCQVHNLVIERTDSQKQAPP